MKKSKSTPEVKAELVSFPVFAGRDPISQVVDMVVAGQRELKVSLRGERVIEINVEKMPPLEQLSQDLSMEQLIELLKIKMYNENINDQTVYDILFEDRLELQWARAYRLEKYQTRGGSIWKKSK